MFRYRHFGKKYGSNQIVYSGWCSMETPVNVMIEQYTLFCELAYDVEIEYKDVTLVRDLIAEDYKDIKFLNGKRLEEYRLRKYLDREAKIVNGTLIII